MKRSVVFLGTPDASVIVLEKLAQHHRIELVVTQPDKKRGRGSALVPSPVKLAAQKHGISIAHELAALDQLPENDDRVYIVVAYGRIIPRDVLERHPMINVHFSLLPRWRGAGAGRTPGLMCRRSPRRLRKSLSPAQMQTFSTGTPLLSHITMRELRKT